MGGSRVQWVGFAGLAQTVVERLLREGSDERDDARASNLPAADVQADARHVLGGECSSLPRAAEAAAHGETAAAVRAMMGRVSAMGGRASSLFAQLEAAAAYLSATAAERPDLPDAAFQAYRRVVAGDLDGPDWRLTPDAEGEEVEGRVREALADELASGAIGVGACCHALQQLWTRAAQRAVAWRERREAGRDMLLRLCVRAWREVADGIPANRAKFAQQWRRGEDCALARRLHISARAVRQWGEVEWLAARRVLTWMRLVRAGEVRRKRARRAAWQAARAQWRMRRHYHGLPHAAHVVETAGRDARAAQRPQRRAEQQRQQQQQRQEREQAREAASAPQQAGAAEDEPASRAATSAHADPQAAHDEHEDGEEAHLSDDSDERSSASGSAVSDGDCGHGHENEPAFERATGDRTRRCDAALRVRVHAARAMRRQLAPTRSLGGGQTRDQHARRARGDG